MGEDELARFRGARIGIVFQSFHLIPTMTALENVAAPLELAGAPDAFARAADELTLVGLAERQGHYPAQLSGGECQRVAVARALINEPKLLLADEPMGSLDQTSAQNLGELIAGLNRDEKVALVVVTHSTELARLGTRRFRMCDGRLVPDQQ